VSVVCGHATVISSFGKSFLSTFKKIYVVTCLQGSLAPKKTHSKRSVLPMVLLPTRPYIGLVISSIDGYVKFLTGFVVR